jgi:hypothetical protein
MESLFGCCLFAAVTFTQELVYPARMVLAKKHHVRNFLILDSLVVS